MAAENEERIGDVEDAVAVGVAGRTNFSVHGLDQSHLIGFVCQFVYDRGLGDSETVDEIERRTEPALERSGGREADSQQFVLAGRSPAPNETPK